LSYVYDLKQFFQIFRSILKPATVFGRRTPAASNERRGGGRGKLTSL